MLLIIEGFLRNIVAKSFTAHLKYPLEISITTVSMMLLKLQRN